MTANLNDRKQAFGTQATFRGQADSPKGIRCNPRSQPPHLPEAITLQYKIEATFLRSFYGNRNRCWPTTRKSTLQKQKVSQATKAEAPRTREPPLEKLISRRYDWLQSFPFQQFHVLFNSLFKVLFIFPSRYLFAIGLSPVFSLRRNLPPILSCNPKQLDSLKAYRKTSWCRPNGILTLHDTLSQRIWTNNDAENASLNYNSDR